MNINIVESVQVMYESKSDNVQMFVSILSSLTVLFHEPLGFV